MKLALLLALVACSRSVAPPPQAAPSSPIPATAAELVVGLVDDWTTTDATLRRYRRAGDGWQPVGEPWPAVVGRTGVAWGTGLHGAVPAGREGPTKREGDGKSPAGVFALRGSYGYAAAPPSGTRLPYTALHAAHQCVDDPASRVYNRIVERRAAASVDWTSFEVMRRDDELYRWVVEVAHNAQAAPGGGSCIFLHVWGGAKTATAGCTAMPEDRLAELIATLDPSSVFVLLPRTEYDALVATWHLPPR